jgi:predicted component of type VI protein secretion system
MKVTLVVASGVHEGKTVPVNAAQFLIGRDPQCQLRPASQAVSKQHCAILIRDGAVFIKDFGSTNGTNVNDGVLRGEEKQLAHNDRVKVGPLDFLMRIEATATHKALGSTPSEAVKKKAEEALSAMKAVAETSASSAVGSETVGRKTPSPSKAPAAAPSKAPAATGKTSEPNQDEIAAMLLGMGEDDASGPVPEGSTVMEIPTPPLPGAPGSVPAAGTPGKPAEKKVSTREETSNAASEILRKMLRRPR